MNTNILAVARFDHVTPDLVADLELALLMAQTADSITMAHFQSLDLIIDTKPDLTPVTEADRQVEQTLRALISGQRPLDSVLGEEFGVTGDSTRQWIIDPIDGTKNYVRGVPVWATLIALAVEDVVVLGVVSAPALGRRWWARLAGGLGYQHLAHRLPGCRSARCGQSPMRHCRIRIRWVGRMRCRDWPRPPGASAPTGIFGRICS